MAKQPVWHKILDGSATNAVVSRHINALIVRQYTMITLDLLRIPSQHKQFLDMAINVYQTDYSVLYYIKYQY